jgi:hypothetical protein
MCNGYSFCGRQWAVLFVGVCGAICPPDLRFQRAAHAELYRRIHHLFQSSNTRENHSLLQESVF